MSNCKFYVVSKDETHMIQAEDFSNHAEVEFVVNNTIALPKLYNSILQKERENCTNEFVGFMHGDVKLDVKKLVGNLERCRGTYDVFGLCGTEVFNVSQTPLNWFTGSRPTPEKRWGCVTHGEISNQMSFFSSHHPEVLDHEVACIDGVCIIFGPRALASEMKFDEAFLWDQYDSDISLQTILTYHMKLGVLVHTDLQHYSVGKGILSHQFLEHEKDFRKKWNIELN